ncbi:MAG: dihydropteroate synthase [Chthoniobacter sp.]|nr:dihydropteroate synthase [Chthoniobacter sp.]
MIWQTKTRTFDLAHRALIMGVVNVTTDSFSDGGQFYDVEAACAHARRLLEDGADIIDIGGESTRPGAEPVSEAEELRRVLPVVERLVETQNEIAPPCGSRNSAIISIDTMKPAVAEAALVAGADVVNDVSGLRDPAMREVVRASGAGAIAMHMQGTPRDMQHAPHYDDVTAEIREFFRQTFEACLQCGIDPMRLAFDPGIGFGKTLAHNLVLIRNLAAVQVGGRPVVLGVSRKSFIGKALGTDAVGDRAWPTVALTSYGRAHGASVFRVHEVLPNVHALRMTEAILEPEGVA